MSTQPIMYGLEGLLPPQEFAVHNATDERLILQYDGETVTLPSMTEVVEKDKRYPERPHSLQDDKGAYMPGTLIIRDLNEPRDCSDGGRGDRWSAAACIQHCLGIDVKSRAAFGTLAQKGVSFIPWRKDAEGDVEWKARIAHVATQGRGRYLRWLEENASTVVATFEERNRNRVRVNLQPEGPDYTVRRAQTILAAAQKRDSAKVEAAIADLEKSITADMPVTPDEDNEIRKIAKSLAKDLQADGELLGDSQLLVQRLLADPEAMAILRTKAKVRLFKQAQADAPGAEAGVPMEPVV